MKTLVIFNDGHSNSTVGLSNPEFQLDDGDTVHAGTVRRWLWYRYQDILAQVAKEAQGDIYGVLNGDAVELAAKHSTNQVITKNVQEAIRIATKTYEPFFQMVKGMYVVRGTEAHTGLSAQAEEAIARNFDNTIHNEATGNASWWHLPLIFDGVRMDIAHHPKGGGSGRPNSGHAGIDRIAADTMFGYANDGEIPPQLVIRSHLHGYRDSEKAFRTRAIITPAMSLLTAYGYRIGINRDNDIGAIMIFCHEGQYHVKPIIHKVRRAEWQTI